MKTEIIVRKGWIKVAKYDFLIPLSKGDIVELSGFEYRVDCCCLIINENKLQILVD